MYRGSRHHVVQQRDAGSEIRLPTATLYAGARLKAIIAMKKTNINQIVMRSIALIGTRERLLASQPEVDFRGPVKRKRTSFFWAE